MIVTKYQAKQLQYKARANKSSKYSTRTVNGCKVKHREFPCCNLEYDEVKDSSGNYVLSNVAIGNEPFEGTYDELLERVSTNDTNHMDAVQECPAIQLEVVTPTDEPITDSNNSVYITFNDDDKFLGILECNGVKLAESAQIPLEEASPKKPLSKAELNDLRIKCATMRLASMYGEPKDSSIADIVGKYNDAVSQLNQLYAMDKIKPYTITEEAIKEAYPDEYEDARY